MDIRFTIVYTDEAKAFIRALPQKVKEKIEYNLTKSQYFMDKEALVIATHGFLKKTQKTPSKEIAKAEAIRKEYFEDKKNSSDMKLYTHEEMLDETFGVKGTPKRDKFEKDIEAYLIGEAIKQTRLKQQLTQKQLGELVGVQEAQISKIESGKSVTYSTIVKVFKAMGAKAATLDLGSLGKVALW